MICRFKDCRRKTKTYKFICDECAEIVEFLPYGRFCQECGADTFQEEHDISCPSYGNWFICEKCHKKFWETNHYFVEEWSSGFGASLCKKCRKTERRGK